MYYVNYVQYTLCKYKFTRDVNDRINRLKLKTKVCRP